MGLPILYQKVFSPGFFSSDGLIPEHDAVIENTRAARDSTAMRFP